MGARQRDFAFNVCKNLSLYDILTKEVIKKIVKNFNLKNTKTRRTFILLAFFIILIICFIAAYSFMQNKLDNSSALVVGSIRISNNEYNVLKEQSNKDQPKDNEFKQQLIENLKYIDSAKKTKISIDESAYNTNAQFLYSKKYDKLNEWQSYRVQAVTIKNLIDASEKGAKEIGLLYFPFSKLFAAGYETPPENYGNKDLIAQNKQYAKAQADKMRNDLVAKNITLDAVLELLHKDDQLTFGYASNGSSKMIVTNDGYVINKDGSKAKIASNEFLQIQQLNKSNVSQIYTLEAEDIGGVEGFDKGAVEIGYYFYFLNKEYNKDNKYSLFKDTLANTRVRDNT